MTTRQTGAQPLVSLILCVPPSIDDEVLLRRSVTSVTSQTYGEWELWLVGTRTGDRQRQTVETLLADVHDPRIHWAPGAGADSKRRGVELSRGELWTFIEPGVGFHPEFLDRAIAAYREAAAPLDMVYCDTYVGCLGSLQERDLLGNALKVPYQIVDAIMGDIFPHDLKKKSVPGLDPQAGGPFVCERPDWTPAAAKRLERENFLGLSGVLVTREAYDAAGGFQDSFQQDWRLWRDMVQAGRDRFHHLRFPGVQNFTSNLDEHRKAHAEASGAKVELAAKVVSIARQVESEVRRYTARGPEPAMARSSMPDGRPRILFFGEAVAISHVARPAMLAAHMLRQGYEVRFACDRRYNDLIAQNAVPFTELYSLPKEVMWQRLACAGLLDDLESLDRYVKEDLEAIRDFQPELIVGDQRRSLAISASLAKVPYISIADAHWSPYIAADYEVLDSPLARMVGTPFANLVFKAVHPIPFAIMTVPLNVVRVKYGLPPIGTDIQTFFTYADYTVYPNDPALFQLKSPLPETHKFIGPILWSADVKDPEWWDHLPAGAPIIYVSMGSTGQPELLPTIFRVLGDMPVTVIASTAKRKTIENMPRNLYLADFLPGTRAAERAHLMICNGGTMSAQQALASGKPFLGLVSNLDQLLYSKTVARSGACEWIRESEVNADILRNLVDKMLADPRYEVAAGQLAARAARWDPCKEFESFVASIFERRGRQQFAQAVSQ